MSRSVRTLAVLALTAWFLAGTVPAAALPAPDRPEPLWSSVWEWLADFFTPDPAGGAPPQDPAPTGDAGVTIDPNG